MTGQPLVISVGQEHFRAGEIALAISPDGALDVRQRRSGRVREWHKRVDPSEVAGLDGFDIATLQPRGTDREPDDDPVVISAGGREVALRHGDRFGDPRLDELLERWQA